MALRRTMNESEYYKIDDGTYTVTCTAVKGDTLENPQFGDGAIIRFSLRFDDLLDENGEEVTRDAIANDKLTPMSKLTGYLLAFGCKASVGEDIDIEECVGKQALAVVEGRVKNEKTYDHIKDLLPAHRAPAGDPTKDISEFWKAIRAKNYTPQQITQTAQDSYGQHPKDLSPEDREAILAEL